MRVGIVANALGSHNGGDETYVRNLIRTLPVVDPDTIYTLFHTAPWPDDAIPPAARLRRVRVRPHTPLVRLPITFPVALARARIDVLHVQWAAPPLSPARIVISVHDLAYERYPRYFTPRALLEFRAVVPLVARRAAAVLTLSEFSKRDIVRRYRVPPEKVIVAGCAADPMFRPVRDPWRLAAVRERYGTGDRFILCVGTLQPRKNLKTLIAAYVRLRRAGAIAHRLVLVGRRGWLDDETFAAARASGYADDLAFTGYVPDTDLVALYNAADLFVYPSLFEGFGIPPLEAMACGTPVVTSNVSSLPEVVGDAALMVDPLDVDGLAGAMVAALHDADLRARLSAAGVRRASRFSWEGTARTVAAVYRGADRR